MMKESGGYINSFDFGVHILKLIVNLVLSIVVIELLHKIVNLTVQDHLRQDARIQDLYFNISEKKLSITSLFSIQIMSYLGASDIIYSDVIDSFISEILKYKSWILVSWRKRSWTVRFTPIFCLSGPGGRNIRAIQGGSREQQNC